MFDFFRHLYRAFFGYVELAETQPLFQLRHALDNQAGTDFGS